MPEQSFKTRVKSDNSFDPKLVFICSKGELTAKFKGNCSTQDDVSVDYLNVVNLFIVYELGT